MHYNSFKDAKVPLLEISIARCRIWMFAGKIRQKCVCIRPENWRLHTLVVQNYTHSNKDPVYYIICGWPLISWSNLLYFTYYRFKRRINLENHGRSRSLEGRISSTSKTFSSPQWRHSGDSLHSLVLNKQWQCSKVNWGWCKRGRDSSSPDGLNAEAAIVSSACDAISSFGTSSCTGTPYFPLAALTWVPWVPRSPWNFGEGSRNLGILKKLLSIEALISLWNTL